MLASCRFYNVKLLILTHAHFDHAENAARISDALGLPIGMNEKDRNLIRSNLNQSLSAETILGEIVLAASLKEFSARPMPEFRLDVLLHNEDRLSDYGIDARIIALPGHTDGGFGLRPVAAWRSGSDFMRERSWEDWRSRLPYPGF